MLYNLNIWCFLRQHNISLLTVGFITAHLMPQRHIINLAPALSPPQDIRHSVVW